MQKHSFILLLAGCFLSLYALGQKKPASRLNVVFFLVDDMGWTDTGIYGSSFYETPHIDALANDAQRFTQAYAACPVCSPTRASIMTGKCPVRTGITDYIGAPQQKTWKRPTKLLPADYSEQLPLDETTLGEAMKAGGYTTFFAGKWHLGGSGYEPQNQGFDINKGGGHEGHPKSYFSPYQNANLTDGPSGEYLPERLANETAAFIKSARNKPFFVYHSFYLVHTPLVAKKELVAKYQRKRDSLGLKDDFIPIGTDVYNPKKERMVRSIQSHVEYAAMVEALDQAVGKVIQTLKDEGLYEQTLIIFTSDNGGLSTSEGTPTSNLPLRAGKGWMYEGGIREPLLIRWPNVTKPGTINTKAVVMSTDYYPTILEAVGLPLKPDQHKDGISLVSVLKGKKQAPRILFWHYPHYGNQGGRPSACVREGNWKLIHFFEDNHDELYDLSVDASEKKDLAATQPARVQAMKTKMESFWKDTKARFPVPNPAFKEAGK